MPNAKLVIPKSPKIYLPPRDDAAEFDDSSVDLKGVVDDKTVISWRKGNKAGIMLSTIVGKDVHPGDEVVTAFGMKFVYTNTVPALEQKEIQTADIVVPVYVVLGKVK